MPLSGPELVAAVESAAVDATEAATAAATRRDSSEAELESAAAELASRLRDLAGTLLPDLGRESLARAVLSSRQELTEIADRRSRRLAELNGRLNRLEAELSQRERDLSAASQQTTASERAVEEKTAELTAYLEADGDYQSMQAALDAARSRFEADERRLAEVRLEAKEKRPDFEADSLFRYLRRRKYGERQYRASRLTRRLDRWVARLIDYPALSRSYAFLSDVPKQMEDELKRRRAELDDLVSQSLQAIERAERQFDIPPLRRQADAKLKELERTRATYERTAETAESVRREIDAILRREGGFYAEAIERYAAALGQAGERILRAEAKSTATLRDDDLVSEIGGLQSRIDGLSDAARSARQAAEDARRVADDLTHVARRAKQSDFGSDRARFPDRFSLDRVLDQLRKGVIDRSRATDVLKAEAEIDPTLAERAYHRTAETLESPTAQVLIGTAAQAALPALRRVLSERR